MKQTLRRDEGYVLPYVLVIFLVVSFVAANLCSAALRNLRAQEAAIQASRALYEAEGQVERLTAQLQALTAASPLCADASAAEAAAAEALWSQAAALGAAPGAELEGFQKRLVTLSASDDGGAASVTARLRVELLLEVTEAETADGTAAYLGTARVAALAWADYRISRTAPEGGGGP